MAQIRGIHCHHVEEYTDVKQLGKESGLAF